jgi:hypothetical protein
VIIAGLALRGIVGRLLANDIRAVVLDHDPDQSSRRSPRPLRRRDPADLLSRRREEGAALVTAIDDVESARPVDRVR